MEVVMQKTLVPQILLATMTIVARTVMIWLKSAVKMRRLMMNMRASKDLPFGLKVNRILHLGLPEDGLEYLRRVRWEAAHIPKVKVSKIDSSKLCKEQCVYMPQIPDIEKCPPHLVPLRQWEDQFVADFSELRLALSHIEDNLKSMIFDYKEHTCRSSQSLSSLELPSGGPTLYAVLSMDPVSTVTMLKRQISLFDTADQIPKNDCAWLFALCAVVDTPLDADTCASLRCLL